MKERHGIADATKIVNATPEDNQSVTVQDGNGIVILILSSNYPAGLTPSQARFIASMLINAADHVEAQGEKK